MKPAKNSVTPAKKTRRKPLFTSPHKMNLLRLKAFARAWQPLKKETAQNVLFRALDSAVERTTAEQREFLFEDFPAFVMEGFKTGDFSQLKLRQKLLSVQQNKFRMKFAGKFLVNRALDSVGIGYTQKDRRLRRKIQKLMSSMFQIDSLGNFKSSRGQRLAVQKQIIEELGYVKCGVMMSKLVLFTKEFMRHTLEQNA